MGAQGSSLWLLSEGFTEPCLIKKTQVIIHYYRFFLTP